jgi:hypothetical protein
MKFLQRLQQLKRENSAHVFLFLIVSSPLRRAKRFLDLRTIARARTLEERFTLIYQKNAWGSSESASGVGSTFAFTESIRNQLPVLLKRFEIRSIFDAPCGDFNWMRFVDMKGIDYLGADIVGPMISDLNKEFSSPSVSFKAMDITSDLFPKCDLVLNRDCLFHLSYSDIHATLTNFLKSNSKYLLSTSHDNNREFINRDIVSGDFRPIDLFGFPFNFPRNFLFEIPEPGDGKIPARKLFLWTREQVSVGHSNLESNLSGL